MKKVEIEKQRGSNRFTVHTNFHIPKQKDLINKLESIKGVEDIDLALSKKYSFTVNIGKLFDTGEVSRKIQQAILSYVEEYEETR